MAVPRNRHSNARKNKRRSHLAKSPVNLRKCTNCSKLSLPHRVCPFCGYYANKLIVQQKETSDQTEE
jgi:large subunit ribosomal protein L32